MRAKNSPRVSPSPSSRPPAPRPSASRNARAARASRDASVPRARLTRPSPTVHHPHASSPTRVAFGFLDARARPIASVLLPRDPPYHISDPARANARWMTMRDGRCDRSHDHRHRDDERAHRSDRRIDRSIDRPARTTRSDHDPIRTIDRSHARDPSSSIVHIVLARAVSRTTVRTTLDDDDGSPLRSTVASRSPSSSPIGRRARVLVLILLVASSSSHLRESVHLEVVASRCHAKIRFDRRRGWVI